MPLFWHSLFFFYGTVFTFGLLTLWDTDSPEITEASPWSKVIALFLLPIVLPIKVIAAFVDELFSE